MVRHGCLDGLPEFTITLTGISPESLKSKYIRLRAIVVLIMRSTEKWEREKYCKQRDELMLEITELESKNKS